MTRLSTRAVNFLFPPTCPVTGEELGIGGGALSATAWGDLAILTGPRCFTCGREVPGDGRAEELCCDPCLRRPPLWTRGRAAFRYEGTGRRLVLSIKHGDRLDLVPMVARFMIQAGPDLVAEADWIAPVPLHWTRMIKRRSNQAAELARRISVIAGRRSAYAPGLLRRIRRTGSQDGRSRAGREANMAGAFGLMPGAERHLEGRSLLLIDDVMTTGATLNAMTRLALDAGATRVDVLVSALVNDDAGLYMARDVVIEDLPDEAD